MDKAAEAIMWQSSWCLRKDAMDPEEQTSISHRASVRCVNLPPWWLMNRQELREFEKDARCRAILCHHTAAHLHH